MGNKANCAPLLRIDGFMVMLEELQLIGSALTRNTIRSIFRRAQYQDEKQFAPPFADDPNFQRQIKGQNAGISTQSVLHYDTFIECLVGIPIHKKPDPYLSLETRVEEFLVNSVIDPLFQQNKISMPFKPKNIENAIKRNRKQSKKAKGKQKKKRRNTVSLTNAATRTMRTKLKKKRNNKSDGT